MNEYEIEEAVSRYLEHPVLGPATRTLANLVGMVNANSDGWPYWRKPRLAAAKLTDLVQQGIRHDREAYQSPRTPDVTAEQYKAALVPLKAFRTRQVRESARRYFAIIDLKPGTGGKVWAAEQVYGVADKAYQQAQREAGVLKELRDRAHAELERIRSHEALRELHAQYEAGTIDAKMIELGMFEPGARIYRLPAYSTEGGFDGLGRVVTVTGLSQGMSGARLDFTADDGTPGIEHRPMTVTEARLRWWVLDADHYNLVTGGTRDYDRMVRLAAEHGLPESCVVQGAVFIQETRELASGPENYGYVPQAVLDAEDR
jgi:hypothetical protein